MSCFDLSFICLFFGVVDCFKDIYLLDFIFLLDSSLFSLFCVNSNIIEILQSLEQSDCKLLVATSSTPDVLEVVVVYLEGLKVVVELCKIPDRFAKTHELIAAQREVIESLEWF